MKFCFKCGEPLRGGQFCPGCGTKILEHGNIPQAGMSPTAEPIQTTTSPSPVVSVPQPPTHQQQPPPQQTYQPPSQYGGAPQYGYAPQPRMHYAPGSFAERFHSFFGSTMYLVAIIILTVPVIFNLFQGVSAIFGVLISATLIVPHWLFFASAKNPTLPEKSLPALTVLKVGVIIMLCFAGLSALGMLIGAFGIMSFSAGAGMILLLTSAALIVFVILYYPAYLKIVKGLREGFTKNSLAPLPQVRRFFILTCVIHGLNAFIALIMAAAVGGLVGALGPILPMLGLSLDWMWIGLIFALMTCVGEIMWVTVLSRFNDTLSYGNQNTITQTPKM